MAVPGLFFAFEIIVVFVISLFLIHKYGNWRKDHWATTISVLTTWFLCFAVIFVLPSDISATFYHRCKENNSSSWDNRSLCHRPWSYVTQTTQKNFWAVTYWSLQLLSWFILPFIQSYVMAAQFTIRGKIFQMLKENAIWYGSFLVIFGVLFLYILIKGLLSDITLKTLTTTAANTWGLLILVLLLGYGLVDMPRSFWYKGRLDYQLQKAYYSVAKLRNDMEEAKEKLDEVFKDVKFVSEKIRYNNPNRHCVDTILAKCPDDLARQGSRGVDDFEDYSDGKQSELTTMSGLVALHGRVIKSSRNAKRTEVQYKECLNKAIAYEDLEENKHNRAKTFISSMPGQSSRLHSFSPRLEWWWRIRIRPILWIIISIVFTVSSLLIVWSEATFFSRNPVLSVPALIIQRAGSGAKDTDASDSKDDYAFIELFTILCIGYIVCCAYYPIYKIRLFNFYYLAPNHQTDQGSLLFNAMFLSRVVAPLCLNFLGLIHMDSHVSGAEGLKQTAFTETMGHLDVIPFISKGFYIYFPIILCVLNLVTLFRLGSHIMACCGFQAFLLDDEMTTELVKQGKNYARLERRYRNRGDNRGGDTLGTVGAREMSSLRNTEPISNSSGNVATADDVESGRAEARGGSRRDRETKRFSSRYSRLTGKDDRVALTTAEEPPDVISGGSSNLGPSPKHPILPKHHSVSTSGATNSRPSPALGRNPPPRNLFDDI